jgi:hypothetical protein
MLVVRVFDSFIRRGLLPLVAAAYQLFRLQIAALPTMGKHNAIIIVKIFIDSSVEKIVCFKIVTL